jgi:hypothetical protein
MQRADRPEAGVFSFQFLALSLYWAAVTSGEVILFAILYVAGWWLYGWMRDNGPRG